MGTESLGVIGCIFAEIGPLEGGIESSFWGTGWGAKGDFMRYSYLYPYIFEWRTHTFSKAHALCYTHSKVGNDQMHIRGEMTSGKWTLSGFVRSRPESLWWFEVDFWPLSVHFRRGPPTIFRKHMPSGMGTGKFGNDRMYIRGEWALRKVALNQVSVVPAGVLRVISDGFLAPIRAFSKGAPHHFPKANALRYGHRKFGSDRMYIRGDWALRRWHWIKFLRYRLGC